MQVSEYKSSLTEAKHRRDREVVGFSCASTFEGMCAYPTEKTQEQSSKLLILLLLKNSRCSLGKPSSSITFILARETWMFEVGRLAIHRVWPYKLVVQLWTGVDDSNT